MLVTTGVAIAPLQGLTFQVLGGLGLRVFGIQHLAFGASAGFKAFGSLEFGGLEFSVLAQCFGG